MDPFEDQIVIPLTWTDDELYHVKILPDQLTCVSELKNENDDSAYVQSCEFNLPDDDKTYMFPIKFKGKDLRKEFFQFGLYPREEREDFHELMTFDFDMENELFNIIDENGEPIDSQQRDCDTKLNDGDILCFHIKPSQYIGYVTINKVLVCEIFKDVRFGFKGKAQFSLNPDLGNSCTLIQVNPFLHDQNALAETDSDRDEEPIVKTKDQEEIDKLKEIIRK